MKTNLALNKKVVCSSYIKPFDGGRAVNGAIKPVARWMSKVPCFMYVDLGVPRWIDEWVIRQVGQVGWSVSAYNLGIYTLLGSNDTVNWVPLDTVLEAQTATTDRRIPAQQFRYFRLNIQRGYKVNPALASIIAFEVYSADPTSSLLSNLEISQGMMQPGFSENVFNYTTEVDYNVDWISLKPTAKDSNATIDINGSIVASGVNSQPISLIVGENIINITVHPKIPGTTSIYSIKVVRKDAKNLESLTINKGTLVPNFAPTMYAYTDTVGYDIQSITITAIAQNPNKKIKVNGVIMSSGSTSAPETLNVGSNVMNIDVQNEDGTVASSYTITVTRGSSSYLNQIVVGGFSGAAKTINTEANKFEYVINVNSNVTGVKVKPVAEDTAATIKVNNTTVTSGNFTQNIPISVGSNVIEINVTASVGGLQSIYKLTINK